MKTMQAILFGGMGLIAVVGLAFSQDRPAPEGRRKLAAPHDEQAAVSRASTRAAADLPVIGYLEKRDRTITIKAGPKGPVYSVKTADGKVLCENLSQEQLRAKAPELAEFLRTAVAGAPGVVIDAGLRTRTDARVRGDARR
jgi:lysophospholipid acyltransferase (LPLAT)-like uncharacterized protein